MRSGFREISRISSLTGSTKWYLSEDCLLAARRMMYAVEYRRFYLRDLESVIVWSNRWWMLRLIIPGVSLAALGAAFWLWVNHTSGAIFGCMSLAWVALELALGPTSRSRIRTTGASIDLPLAPRTCRARKVLARIDAAVRATRNALEQPTAPAIAAESARPPVQAGAEASPANSIAGAAEKNAS